MNLFSSFIRHIASRQLFSVQDHLLLAVSGGVDSVVLCELCRQAGFPFSIAHCNFRLRGDESDRDEAFVQKLAAEYAVKFYLERFDTEKYAAAQHLSVQEAARELRYSWFAQLINTIKAEQKESCLLLTAHHADDNVETLLMNFCRGTGLRGLTGIPPTGRQDALSGIGASLKRPLLPFFKSELIQYARDHQLQWVEDSSNDQAKYTRNYFRHDILPAIAKAYPQVKDNLRDNIERFTEIAKLYELAVGEIKKKLCRQRGSEVHIPVKQLMSYHNKALIYDIISEYGFTEKQMPDIISLTAGESGRYIISPGADWRIIRHRHWLIVSPAAAAVSENIIIETGERTVSFAGGVLELNHSNKTKTTDDNRVANLDAKFVTYPLLLRRWKAGDYFYPLGMRKKKKVARFLIDQKLSKADKEKIWVLEMDQKIIWVVGYRIDDRFKIDGSTKEVLHISVSAAPGKKH